MCILYSKHLGSDTMEGKNHVKSRDLSTQTVVQLVTDGAALPVASGSGANSCVST